MGCEQRIERRGASVSRLPGYIEGPVDLHVRSAQDVDHQIRTMMQMNPERLLPRSKPICPKS
jgi:hypothetical protein